MIKSNPLLKFTVDKIKPIQSNDSYVPAYNHKKRYSYFRKSSELKVMQAEFEKFFEINEPVPAEELSKFRDLISNNTLLDLCLIIRVPKSDIYFKNGKLKTKDTSNYIKPLEDCIYSYLGVDDKHNTTIHVERVAEDGRDDYLIEVYVFEGYSLSIHDKLDSEDSNIK